MAVSLSIPSMTTEQSAQPSDISLSSVYDHPERHKLLWQLMLERDDAVNISHRALPTWEQHVGFVEKHPYKAWYFVRLGNKVVGACYLTAHNEIGIFIFGSCQGQGYGPQAVKALMAKEGPGRYLANINPKNERSLDMFSGMGFRLIQHTLEFDT